MIHTRYINDISTTVPARMWRVVTDYLFRIQNSSGNVNEIHFSRGYVSQWHAKFASRRDRKRII